MIKGWKKTASALQKSASGVSEKSCVAADLKHRAAFQNKLAGACEDMCKEVGAYPKCTQCPAFVPPDPTPGVMTWDELLDHMDNLVGWGQGKIKGWTSQARSFAQRKPVAAISMDVKACAAADVAFRMKMQNKLAGACEDMCKEVGAYPKCTQCPAFVPPDPTPGVMTWDELLEHMDNLVGWGRGELKTWAKQAAGA